MPLGTVITRFRLSPGVVSTTYAVITLVTEPIGRLITDERDQRLAPVAAFASSAKCDRMPTGTEAGFAATAASFAAVARSPVAARAAGAVTPPARIIPATTATAASPTAIRMRHLLPRPDEVTRILSVRPPSGCGLRLNFLPSGCVLRLETVSVTPFAWRAPARGVSLHWIPERDTMVGMDSWCPSCGYSVEPGTRFCGGCGQQIAAQDGASAAQSSTVTMQSPPAPFPGYAAPAALPAPVAPMPAPAAPAPPPPAGSPLPWAPPPTGAPVQPPAPGQQP